MVEALLSRGIRVVPAGNKTHTAAMNGSIAVAVVLRQAMDELGFITPSHVYNPLHYAGEAHAEYLRRWGWRQGRVLLLGMNPGPWGMAQTGVPFGDVAMVRDFLGITEPLMPPLPEQHEKYPILGPNCHRREGSGTRFWGWVRDRFGTADAFFEHFFVWNLCPLLFIAHNRNLVPGKLTQAEAEPLLAACDTALAALVQQLRPRAIVGIGRWAEQRARHCVGDTIEVGYLHHPSPANPKANRNWPAMAEAALTPWLK